MSNTPAFYRGALREKTHQLMCLLVAIEGTGDEGFHGLRDDIKDGYIKTCVELAETCVNLANEQLEATHA